MSDNNVAPLLPVPSKKGRKKGVPNAKKKDIVVEPLKLLKRRNGKLGIQRKA